MFFKWQTAFFKPILKYFSSRAKEQKFLKFVFFFLSFVLVRNYVLCIFIKVDMNCF